jgi:hypothetical protein
MPAWLIVAIVVGVVLFLGYQLLGPIRIRR